MEWNALWGEWKGNAIAYRTQLSEHSRLLPKSRRSQWAATQRRILRSHVCGLVAGPLAERIFTGDSTRWRDLDDAYDDERKLSDDIGIAKGICMLLPYADEYAHACQITEAALREPEIWQNVLRLARALERSGDIQKVDDLPLTRKHWPPLPARRVRRRAKPYL
jgi:hypothetical protein